MLEKTSDVTCQLVGYKNTKNAVSFLDLSSRKTKSLKSDELRLANNNWGLAFNLDEQTITLVNKIRAGKSNLKNAVDIISQGLIAYDARRGQDEFTIKNRVYHHDNSASNQVHGKWLWGADVTPYSVKWNGEERLDYCDGIANPRQKEYFDGSRILVREITNPKIYAGYTEAQYYHDPAVILIKDRKENLLPILGILNSKLATYFHFNSSPKATKGDFPKILVKDIKDFPLPDIDDEVKSRLSMKVSAIRNIIAANSYAKGGGAIKGSSKGQLALEAEIDELVFDLYELTDEERQLVRDTVN